MIRTHVLTDFAGRGSTGPHFGPHHSQSSSAAASPIPVAGSSTPASSMTRTMAHRSAPICPARLMPYCWSHRRSCLGARMPPWEPDRNEVVFEKWEWLVMADQAMLHIPVIWIKVCVCEYNINIYTMLNIKPHSVITWRWHTIYIYIYTWLHLHATFRDDLQNGIQRVWIRMWDVRDL